MSSGYTFPKVFASLLILHTREYFKILLILQIRSQCYVFKLHNLYYVNSES